MLAKMELRKDDDDMINMYGLYLDEFVARPDLDS